MLVSTISTSSPNSTFKEVKDASSTLILISSNFVESSSLIALILHVPTFLAVTLPLKSTEATLESLDSKLTSLLTTLLGKTLTFKVNTSPTFIVTSAFVILIESTCTSWIDSLGLELLELDVVGSHPVINKDVVNNVNNNIFFFIFFSPIYLNIY